MCVKFLWHQVIENQGCKYLEVKIGNGKQMIMTMDELDMEMLKNVLNSCGLMLNGMEGNQAASVLEIPENMTYVNQAAYPRNRAQVYKKLANKNFSNKNKLIKLKSSK